MMEKEKYKKELLDKYLSKSLSSDERHELERLALDDPFLFEALNGFAQAKEDHRKDIAVLRKNILSEPVKKKTRSIVPYGIAASLLVVLGLSFWLSDIGGPKEMSTMADASSEATTNRVGHKAEVAEVSIPETVDVKSIGVNVVSGEADGDDESKEKRIAKAKEIVEELKNETQETKEEPYMQIAEGEMEVKLETVPPINPVIDGISIETSSIENRMNEAGDDMQVQDEINLDEESTSSESKTRNKTRTEKKEASMDLGAVVEQQKNSPIITASNAPNSYSQSEGFSGTFDEYFKLLAREEFTNEEIKSLNDKVSLDFRLVDDEISAFKVIPSQGQVIDAKLLEIVIAGASLIEPKDSDTVQYKITSL